MDVDPAAESSANYATDLHATAGMPKIDESKVLDHKPPKQRILEVLDTIETHVEKLRNDAFKLEDERDSLLTSLDTIMNGDFMGDIIEFEKEDIHRYRERIVSRCMSIEVRIVTHRDTTQEEALHQVNSLIDSLVMSMKTDPDVAKARCISYMNACSSHFVQGVTDKNFESALLGCALDDQKRVKKRLQGLLHYFDRLNLTTLSL